MQQKFFNVSFGIIFLFGIIMILKSNSWGIGDFLSMNLAGTILCVFSGTAIIKRIKK